MSTRSSNTDLENGHVENGQRQDNVDETEKHLASTPDRNERQRLPFGQWVEERMSWSWFTCTQSTGGIAAMLSLCPKQFSGLETIGAIIFILNLVLYPLFIGLMAFRWASKPATIKQCFTTAPECFFFGSLWLSAATMIINAQRYGVPHAGPWLVVAVRVLFWMYAAVSLSTTVLQIVVIARATPLKALESSPAIIILILSAMLTGTVAATIAESQPPHQRVAIMVAGVAYQGLGWIVCMIFLTLTVGTLLEKGWPPANLRPGLFLMTSASSFTIVALIGIARAAPTGYGYFATHPTAREILLVVATWVGAFMWLFSLWTFGVALVITVWELFVKKDGSWTLNLHFENTAWGMIFPNVGWVISTVYIGQEFESQGILWVSVVMTVLLVAVWLLELFLMAKNIFRSLYIDSRIKLS